MTKFTDHIDCTGNETWVVEYIIMCVRVACSISWINHGQGKFFYTLLIKQNNIK